MYALSAAKAIAASLLALLISTSTDASDHPFKNINIGEAVPGFTLKDTNGSDVSLASYKGKVTLVLFVRPDQKNSQSAMADLQKLMDKYGPKGLAVVAMTPETQQATELKDVVEKEKITYPALLDEGKKVYGEWGAFLFPTTAVLDKEGKMIMPIPSYNRTYPDVMEGYVQYALGEIGKEQLDAIVNPKGSVRLTPEQKNAERHMMLGQRMIDRKLIDKAAEEYGQAVESDPTLVDAHIKYGYVLLKLGDSAKALEQFTKALELDPKAEEASTGLGSVQVSTGNFDKAIEVLEANIKTNPKPARAHYELGVAYEKKGVFDKAAEHYKKAAEELGGIIW